MSADTVFVSTGDDKKLHIWSLNKLKAQHQEFLDAEDGALQRADNSRNYASRATYVSKNMLLGLDHSYSENLFATGGSVVQIWNYERSMPLQTFEWGVDTITRVKFNPS